MEKDACTEELSKHMLELAWIYGRTVRERSRKNEIKSSTGVVEGV